MPDAYSPIRSLASLCMLALSASTFAVMLASDGAAVASRGPGAAPIAWSSPATAPESLLYVIKTGALAHRCGEVSGRILRHISTADTVRDLDYLRQLVGDRQLTYLGISGGTFIGQTYVNMFPRRVRAMVLDGVVNAAAYTKGTEAGYANQLSYSDRAFQGFLALCEDAGPARCAL